MEKPAVGNGWRLHLSGCRDYIFCQFVFVRFLKSDKKLRTKNFGEAIMRICLAWLVGVLSMHERAACDGPR